MTPKNLADAPNPQLPLPSALQFGLFGLMLGWLAAAPVLLQVVAAFLLPELTLTGRLFLALGLTLLLTLPAAGLALLARQKNWIGFKPLALALLATALYVSAASLIRAVSAPGGNLEAILNVLALTLVALLLGGLALLAAGVPGWLLSHAFGFDRPTLTGGLAALAIIALITLGWPVTGALGDSWEAQMLLLRAFAANLPELIFFFGAVLGIITFNFQHKKWLAALVTLLIYLAASLSQLLPHGDWWALVRPLTLLPLGLLLIELRALSGGVWPGLFVAIAYRAAPLLFTDPRDELPLLTQPWQSAARLWLLLSALAAVALLWAGRQFLLPRAKNFGLIVAVSTLALALLWLGLWFSVGYPGFYNDGFLIILSEQADLSGAAVIADPTARREFVRERLLETARRTQPPVTQALDAAGLAYRPFYLINMIRVDASHRHMNEFASLPGVARVLRNPNVRPYPITFNLPYGNAPQTGSGAGWNIAQVNADKVWAQGITGQGIVIAGQDTGYEMTHPALLTHFRGYTGPGQIDANFNWRDAWDNSPAPFDDDQHGTHTMGTMVGDDGGGNQIGMAPGAQWIGCRNMRRGIGNPASYTDCMEFFLAPYPVGGNPFTDGDVTQAPHVINNSWGCPAYEGCDAAVLEPAAAALRAAGIMMVVSAGNDGPACETVLDPPARYDDVFSVGAVDDAGEITGFSSRGPVPPNDTLLKPDIAAPGAAIRSSVPGGAYALADGTSMAGPHVTGLVALIWSANPALIGRIDATEDIIRQSARPTVVIDSCAVAVPSTLPLAAELEAVNAPAPCACGGVTGAPNNVFGWGQIDALRAVQMAQNYKP